MATSDSKMDGISEPNSEKPAWKTVKFWQAISVVLLLVCIVLACVLAAVAAANNTASSSDGQSQTNGGQTVTPCPTGLVQEPVDEANPGVFDDLSVAEHSAVLDYMIQEQTLDIKAYDEAMINDNYIHAIELHIPVKSEVLDFVDGGGAKPERQALVTVYAGGKSPPIIEEYVVGPLPNPARHTLYAPAGRRSPIPWVMRPPDPKEYALLNPIIDTAMFTVHDILKESYGHTYHNCTAHCLIAVDTVPKGYVSGQRRTWFMFHRNGHGGITYLIDFHIQIVHESYDPSEWYVSRVYYNGQYFDTLEELVRAYADGTVEKDTPDADVMGDNVVHTTFQRRGKPQPASPRQAPTLTEPGGKRYAVRGRRVEYMGWSFDWRISPTQSMQLYDIRMNGERIAYEISSREAAAFYGGFNPITNLFVDSAWEMGRSFELVRGVDCPETATFFDTLQQKGTAGPRLIKNAVCLFELDGGIPLRRHFESDFVEGFKFYGGMADHMLVLRHINTVLNYDYVYDYIFHQNGVIEVRVSLTGYIIASHDDPKYGYPLWGGEVGNIHQHTFSYKVDVDVVGSQNRFETVELVLENVTKAAVPEIPVIQNRIERKLKTTEKEAALQYDFNQPKYYNFYSEQDTNRFGANRGYRIQLNGISKTLLPRETWGPMRGVGWMDYQLAVTKRKESEPSSSSIYNQNDLFDPLVDFQTFIDDDENIVDEDLVAWVALGTHHIPHSEDFPVTATAGSQQKFFLRPFNFYDEDASIGSSNAVLITPGEKFAGPVRVDRFGTPTGPACVSEQSPFHYNGTWRGSN